MCKISGVLFNLVVLLLICITSSAHASDKKIQAVFVSWEPYGYIENKRAVGFELDIFSAVFNEMNMEVKFNERPWKRCLYMVKHGLADVVISALKTPEREVFMIYPKEFISINKSQIIVRINICCKK